MPRTMILSQGKPRLFAIKNASDPLNGENSERKHDRHERNQQKYPERVDPTYVHNRTSIALPPERGEPYAKFTLPAARYHSDQ